MSYLTFLSHNHPTLDEFPTYLPNLVPASRIPHLASTIYYLFILLANPRSHGVTDRPQRVTRSMNTVDTERPPTRTRDSRKPRQGRTKASSTGRVKSKPKFKHAAKKPKQQKPSSSQSDEGWFALRDILDEKVEHGRIFYLIDWDGTDSSGCRYDPTWVRPHAAKPRRAFVSSFKRLTGAYRNRPRT